MLTRRARTSRSCCWPIAVVLATLAIPIAVADISNVEVGLLNALLVRRAVAAITMEDHPLKKKMAMNSAMRLLIITAIALAVAIIFKAHGGIAVLFGLAIFQGLLVISTSFPVMRKIRANGLDVEDVSASDSKG